MTERVIYCSDMDSDTRRFVVFWREVGAEDWIRFGVQMDDKDEALAWAERLSAGVSSPVETFIAAEHTTITGLTP